jgi:hypothetical protein
MDFYKLWQIIENSQMNWKGHPDMERHYGSPEDEREEPPTLTGEKEFDASVIAQNRSFFDAHTGKKLEGLENYARLSGGHKEYTLRVGLKLSARTYWDPRRERLELNEDSLELNAEWGRLEEDENASGFGLHEDDALGLFSLEGEAKNTPYKVHYDLVGNRLHLSVH